MGFVQFKFGSCVWDPIKIKVACEKCCTPVGSDHKFTRIAFLSHHQRQTVADKRKEMEILFIAESRYSNILCFTYVSNYLRSVSCDYLGIFFIFFLVLILGSEGKKIDKFAPLLRDFFFFLSVFLLKRPFNSAFRKQEKGMNLMLFFSYHSILQSPLRLLPLRQSCCELSKVSLCEFILFFYATLMDLLLRKREKREKRERQSR